MSQVKIDVYNMKGEKTGKTSLPEDIFALQLKDDLIHQAVVTQLANKRSPIANTQTKGEVSGGGAKPWRQKGTGRARHGSSRSPIWIGGGITFGPTKARSFGKSLNKKMRKAAILMALSQKYADKRLLFLDKLSISEIKTKKIIKWLDKMPIKEGNILLVLPDNNQNIKKSASNIPYIETILANSLNVVDIIRHDWVIMPKEAIEVIKKTYTGQKIKNVQ